MKYFYLVVSLLLVSCHPIKKITATNENWASIFSEKGINGTFVLYNLATTEMKFHNALRADSSYIPASTFKILNSLIALETKIVKDETDVIKWDGIDKGWNKWNQDHTMKSALPVSCVWFYQELARRIGQEKMQYWLSKVAYGNQKMGADVDQFWLKGDLKISAREQVLFLKKLVQDQLPFGKNNLELVKKIMITDSTSQYVIHSKTGWGSQQHIGWLVGFIEKKEGIWAFALNMDIKKKADLKWRKKIIYSILKKEGVIEY